MKKNLKFLPYVLIFSYLSPVIAQNSQLYFTVLGREKQLVTGQNIYTTGLYTGLVEGTDWQHLGWKNNWVYSVLVDKSSQGKHIFLACANGVMRSLDSGKTWKIITNWQITEVLNIYQSPQNSQILYLVSSFGIWKSSDYGETWAEKNKGLKITSETFVRCLFIFPPNPNTLIAGTANGLVISKDAGENWQSLALSNQEIHHIERHPSDNQILVCATEDQGIYISRDAGKTRQATNEGLQTLNIYTIIFDPQNPAVMYCGGYLSGLYKSKDLGKHWDLLDNSLKGKSIHCLLIHPQQNKVIFAGCLDFGLHKSINYGYNFECVGECKGKIWEIAIY